MKNLFIALISVCILCGCQKEDIALPELSTSNVSELTNSSAASGGTIISTGGGDILSKGVCWSLEPNPTIKDNYTTDGSGSGSFSSLLTGLSRSKEYYVRAYAENEAGIGYGDQIQFETPLGTVTDIDGNEYALVKVGDQIWMADNLKTTTFNYGTDIPLLENNNEWINQAGFAYCWYLDSPDDYADTYGALYNWPAVNTNTLCPEGWRIPTLYEWSVLVTNTDGEFDDYGLADEYRSGYRRTSDGSFIDEGASVWWSSTEKDNTTAWMLAHSFSGNFASNNLDKKSGLSVRCIMESE